MLRPNLAVMTTRRSVMSGFGYKIFLAIFEAKAAKGVKILEL